MKNSGAMKANRGNVILVLLLIIVGVLVIGPVMTAILAGAVGTIAVTFWAIGVGIAILMGLLYAVGWIYANWPRWQYNMTHRNDVDDEAGWSKPRPPDLKKG